VQRDDAVVEYFPALQLEQDVANAAEKVPALHMFTTDSPIVSQKFPAVQAVQEDWPVLA